MSKRVFSIVSVLLALVFIVSIAQPAYSSNDGKMRVWVEFSPGNGARVEKALQGFGAEFHYRFEDLNSFVVTVPEQALEGLSRNPNVESIEEDPVRYPMSEAVPEAPYGVEMVQALQVWDADEDGQVDPEAPTGAGITVCVIDSGLYTGHEDLSGLSVNGFNDGWNEDTCGHGTHVAGTIAAISNDVGVVGVTPGGAELYIVKVFDGPECGWSYSSTLANAAQQCQAAGAKIISMSLGGAQKNKLEERAFNNLYAAGILSIAAAGNEGTSAYNYPASYSSVVSVAAIDSSKTVADFSQFNDQVELAAPGVGVLSTVPFKNVATVSVSGGTYSGNPIEYAPLAKLGVSGALVDGGLCDTAGTWSEQVVLCQRGDNSFYEKVMSVQSGGGVAAIIYNNVPGDFLGTLGEGYTSTIPAISLSQENGLSLIANELGNSATVVTDFEIPSSSYEAWDGTSMATPHVSGAAALIWSADTTWTNIQIREALQETAEDLGAADRDVYYGYGLVQAKAALDYLGGTPSQDDKEMTLTVTASPSIVTNNKSVTITVTATDADSPVKDVKVTVLIYTSNKEIATLTGTTTSSGVATFSYRVRTKTTGFGDINVKATGSKEGYITTSVSTTFKVQ